MTPGLTLGTLYSSGVGINKTKQHKAKSCVQSKEFRPWPSMRHATSQSSPMRHATSQSKPMRHATSQSSPMRHTTSHRLYRVMSRHLTLSACLCHFSCHSLSASLRAESVRVQVVQVSIRPHQVHSLYFCRVRSFPKSTKPFCITVTLNPPPSYVLTPQPHVCINPQPVTYTVPPPSQPLHFNPSLTAKVFVLHFTLRLLWPHCCLVVGGGGGRLCDPGASYPAASGRHHGHV